MVRRYASLTGAVAVVCTLSFAAVPAHSVPLTSLKADSGLTLVKRDGGGKGGKHHGGNKNWSNKGGNKHWSGKGHGGKKWSNYGKWHGGDRYRGGYWRNGIFLTLPFVVGDQCYDYLDWRDGAPRPGWYWVC
jgi:uncharacterized membrane protein